MACETRLKPRQTIAERAEEVRKAVQSLDLALRMNSVKPVIGPQGAITFPQWDNDRDGVTDTCAYRQIMASGSAMAKAAIARAEQMSGRTVNRQALAQGIHSHDGGKSWGRD